MYLLMVVWDGVGFWRLQSWGFRSAASGHHGVPAGLEFGGREFFDFVLKHPLVAGGVEDGSAAEAVEVIGEGHVDGGAGGDGAIEGDVGVWDDQAEGDGCSGQGEWGFGSPLWVFLGDHDEVAVDQQFGVVDGSVGRVGQADAFGGIEGGFVEFDGLFGVADGEVWAE